MTAVEVKVSKKHLNALVHGKGFNLSRSEHNTAPHLIHIHYRDAKHARKVHKKLSEGGSIRINPCHMIDVTHNGGSLWGNITHGIEHVASNPVFKAVAPILLNAGVSAATENPEAGMIAGNVGSAALNANGSGLRRTKRKGAGFFDTMKKVAENKATKSIAKSLAPTIAKAVEERTGSQLAGNLSNAGVDAYAGSGLKKKRGKGIITDNIDNFLHNGMGLNTVGLGGSNSSITNSMHDKMAYVRSFRKLHHGGSMNPL